MPHTSRPAIVPGTFDPITNGHLDLIARARRMFDRVIVAVLVNRAKAPWFATDVRVAMIVEALADANIEAEVETFDGLLADYVAQRNAVAVVRALRTEGELAAELPVALMNRHLNPSCETIFVVPDQATMHVSSRLVREIAAFGGRVDDLVPAAVRARLQSRS